MQRWLYLVLFFVASYTVAAIGGYATAGSVHTWYPTLVKPSWNPPAAVFAPVWTVLYAAMSLAAWRIWLRRDQPGAGTALRLFFASLVLNALWSVLFFGLQRPGWALLEVVVLWGTLSAVEVRFRQLDRVAGWLWAPYVAWVSFATVLNGAIWWLNR
ncbi:MAG: TspO/MBR family protein [Verrucomicrobiota bacterium]|nr:tryptophan-rich sensory protein [Opitutales bacterium]